VLYVFRCMVADNIPMNAGCLKPITIVTPEGSMLSPELSGRRGGRQRGDSQACHRRACSVRSKAVAASQGTMNNFTFGNAKYQYYETICSGTGAGPGYDGTPAVHTHMTNTRLTDPEILEFRYPVVLEDFHIRRGAGGHGKWSGGGGIRRTVRFLEQMDVSLLTGHRRVPPFGLEGGEPGEVGQNWCRRADGSMEQLNGCDQTVVQPGDAIIIQTPTGGGYGKG
jgi:5-oxoprolinase (ATP-hydrolysing)